MKVAVSITIDRELQAVLSHLSRRVGLSVSELANDLMWFAVERRTGLSREEILEKLSEGDVYLRDEELSPNEQRFIELLNECRTRYAESGWDLDGVVAEYYPKLKALDDSIDEDWLREVLEYYLSLIHI